MEHRKLISTKADTLFALRSLIHESVIEKCIFCRWETTTEIKSASAMRSWIQFRGRRIVVRSSSTAEDSFQRSNAGHYKSILDVDSSSEQEIIDAVDAVIASYRRDIHNLEEEQVLIQCQARNVMLGVWSSPAISKVTNHII